MNKEIKKLTKSQPSVLFSDYLLEKLPETSTLSLAKKPNSERSSTPLKSVLSGRDKIENYTLFSNALVIVPSSHEHYRRPSQRVTLEKYFVLTLEFDDDNFLWQQLGWINRRDDCPIYRFNQSLRNQFSDYVGLSVVYSGNKSLHYHFVFDSTILLASGVDPILSDIRGGMGKAWDRLSKIFTTSNILNVPEGMTPDPSLRSFEQYRRVPNATRKLESKHTIGLSVAKACSKSGEVVQACLFEELSKRAKASSGTNSGSFFEIADFNQSEDRRREARKTVTKARSHLSSSHELYLLEQMRNHFPLGQYPEPVSISLVDEKFEARFHNSPSDNNPSSVMTHDHNTVLQYGFANEQAPVLPKSLGEFCQHHLDIEEPFKNVESQAAAMHEMHQLMGRVVDSEVSTWITAPEGISKSRGLFAALAARPDGITMMAYSSYDVAEEKSRDFQSPNHTVIVHKSFSRIYAEQCDHFDVKPVDLDDHIKAKSKNRLETIRTKQPQVFAAVKSHFENEERLIKSGKPVVIFTAHAVAKSWSHSTGAEMLGNPVIDLLIHDEISHEDLLTIISSDKMNFVDQYRAQKNVGYQAKINGFRKLANPDDYTLEEIDNLSGMSFEPVVTRDSREYDTNRPDCFYRKMIGATWYVSKRDWLSDYDKTIVLTTEIVPTLVAKDHFEFDFEFIDIETPKIARDKVETFLKTSLSSKSFQAISDLEKKNNSNAMIITNRAKGDDIENSIRARGSNLYLNHDAVTIIGMYHKDKFGMLQALNAYCGRDDFVLNSHIDEMNQCFGRNLGFRNMNGKKHKLIINAQLHNWLVFRNSIGLLRYDLAPVVSDDIVKRVNEKNKRKGKKI